MTRAKTTRRELRRSGVGAQLAGQALEGGRPLGRQVVGDGPVDGLAVEHRRVQAHRPGLPAMQLGQLRRQVGDVPRLGVVGEQHPGIEGEHRRPGLWRGQRCAETAGGQQRPQFVRAHPQRVAHLPAPRQLQHQRHQRRPVPRPRRPALGQVRSRQRQHDTASLDLVDHHRRCVPLGRSQLVRSVLVLGEFDPLVLVQVYHRPPRQRQDGVPAADLHHDLAPFDQVQGHGVLALLVGDAPDAELGVVGLATGHGDLTAVVERDCDRLALDVPLHPDSPAARRGVHQSSVHSEADPVWHRYRRVSTQRSRLDPDSGRMDGVQVSFQPLPRPR